ncbi:MAG: hypothetical protein Q9163_002447 [Psora crenata]
MDLANGPVFAVDVFRGSNEPHTLLMSAHHVILNLVSWRIIWHELTKGGKNLDPATVLPFEITPANFEYLGVTPGEVFCKDSAVKLSVVESQESALLLGASNNCFRTEVLDILLSSLSFCFAQISEQTKTERLVTLHKQCAESLAHETTDLSYIVRHCTDWPLDTKDYGCWIQYENIDQNPVVNLPGALGRLESKEMWKISVAANFLEIFATPENSGMLRVRLIATPGYAEDGMTKLHK